MKRFDYANDVSKQLITIASAIITVVIAFYDKFFSHETIIFCAVLAILLIFIFSIISGISAVGSLTNRVELQELSDWQKLNLPPGSTALTGSDALAVNTALPDSTAQAGSNAQGKFINLGKSARKFTIWQFILFAGGLVLFILVAIGDRKWFAKTETQELLDSKGDKNYSRPIEAVVWTQLLPDNDTAQGQLIARAVVGSTSQCPEISFEGQGFWDGKRWRMAERWVSSGGAFPIKVCETNYPGHLSATVGTVRLEPRPADPNTILLLGDTGCRITSKAVQGCSDSQNWPFKRISATAATLKPDLIIHVGDYHYREAPCPDRAKCADSAGGDNWSMWKKDFFDPAEALLARAPWVMLRGNHEGWTRAGPGWQVLLAPAARYPSTSPWPEEYSPYSLRFGQLTLAVFDVANGDDPFEPKRRAEKYENWLRTLAPAQNREPNDSRDQRWLLIHSPLWASLKCDAKSGCKTNFADDSNEPINALRRLLLNSRVALPKIDAMFSGDTHMFQYFAPKQPNLPLQIVAGMSGTMLESEDTYDKSMLDKTVNADLFTVVGRLFMRREFGFLLLKKNESGTWAATFYDANGKPQIRCDLKNSAPSLTPDACQPV